MSWDGRFIFRSFAALIPGATVAAIVWYLRHGYSLSEQLQVLGMVATGMLTVLAIVTLRPRYWRRYGRMAVAAFAAWAASSTLFRMLSFLDWITVEQRLHANTIVALTLGLSGFYVMFTHQYLVRFARYLQGGGANEL